MLSRQTDPCPKLRAAIKNRALKGTKERDDAVVSIKTVPTQKPSPQTFIRTFQHRVAGLKCPKILTAYYFPLLLRMWLTFRCAAIFFPGDKCGM
jgi:hypothetical protein